MIILVAQRLTPAIPALSRAYGYASNGAGFYDDKWT